MYPCELNMLTDGVGDDLPSLRYGIDLYFLSVLDELAHDHRMLLRYVCR